MTTPTTIDAQATLAAIALAQPAVITTLERLKLDYCCGGNRRLADACAEKNLAVETVLSELKTALGDPAAPRDLSNEPLSVVIAEIVNTHHAYVRAQLPPLTAMAAKVAGKHGPIHPEQIEVQRIVLALAEDLTNHLAKEELILFPYIQKLEQSLKGNGELPHACFASVSSPISAMEQEHETAGALLVNLRALTHDYTLPEGACNTFTGLYAGLQAFEQDLHLHIHRENNLLFPRAIELEKSVQVEA